MTSNSKERTGHGRLFGYLLVGVLVGGLGMSFGVRAAPKLPRITLPKFTKPLLAPQKAEDLEPPETRFIQVAPASTEPTKFIRSIGQRRAVVLIHGYWLLFKKERVAKAIFKDWQDKDSPLVTALGKDSDVFAFAYGQTVSVEEVAHLKSLRDNIVALKKLGYRQIVLVGHSAGGLVARYFVEDFPDACVTKVVQVCAPNGGSLYADIKFVPKNQKNFVSSLSKASREKCLVDRENKKIPKGIEFVCVLGAEDYVVPCKYQWTKDLQDQGVPVVTFLTGHRQVMRKTAATQKMADVILEKYPRWKAEQVAVAVGDIFKVKKKAKKQVKQEIK